VDPAEPERSLPDTASRARMRRRARYLRAARELLLRDLGGFVLEVHRTAGREEAGHRRLREVKLERLAAVDAELRDLERRLGDPRGETVIRQPGVGGDCPTCGELHASDANWCAHCGAPLSAAARKRRAAEQATASEAPQAQAAGTGGQPGGAEPAAELPSARPAAEPTGELPAAEDARRAGPASELPAAKHARPAGPASEREAAETARDLPAGDAMPEARGGPEGARRAAASAAAPTADSDPDLPAPERDAPSEAPDAVGERRT
jgi:hypothetical protein